ncbi:MAG: hypothetical protein GC159_16605 [Phycisphaera sp.]|nr:hypothetical protein [Phycisphaera sp.]
MDTPNNADGGNNVLVFVLFIFEAALLVIGIWLGTTQHDYTLMGLGMLAIAVSLSLYLFSGGQGGGGGSQAMKDQNILLNSINERMLISDQAKRIAYRQKDREALRQAILSDMRMEDYDAAMALVKDMSEVYGYREEAEQFRQQILEQQSKKRDALIERHVSRIDELCTDGDWVQARHEADRLMRMYPDFPSVRELPNRIRQARDKHKQSLIVEFKEAFDREDMNRAMDLLKEMDKYLTPEEAAPYAEMAREVLAKKKENMGVRFKMAVQDRDWIEALNVGEQLIKDYPNSAYADEVRQMLDQLRDRAAAQRAAMSKQGAK